MAAGLIAMGTGCRGPNLCLTTACAAGATSLGTALDLIRGGRCDVALAGAAESTISPFAIDGYCQLHALSTRSKVTFFMPNLRTSISTIRKRVR